MKQRLRNLVVLTALAAAAMGSALLVPTFFAEVQSMTGAGETADRLTTLYVEVRDSLSRNQAIKIPPDTASAAAFLATINQQIGDKLWSSSPKELGVDGAGQPWYLAVARSDRETSYELSSSIPSSDEIAQWIVFVHAKPDGEVVSVERFEKVIPGDH